MTQLDILRKSIDEIDQTLLQLLSKRLKLVKKIGEYKKLHSIPVQDRKREAEILKKRVAQAKKLGLSPKFVAKFWELLFKTSYNIEK